MLIAYRLYPLNIYCSGFPICIVIFDITVSMGSQITGLVFMQFLLDGYQWYCFER